MVGDEYDCLARLDRWLEGGIFSGVAEALAQQGWPESLLAQLKAQWAPLEPGQGFILRGRGWRLWLANGHVVSSREALWDDVPERQIILGVSYNGPQRWMAQGRDPYWLHEGLLYDARTGGAEGRLVEGVYVTDERMREARRLAVLAFTL